jgi:hypothetical protein
LSTNPREFISNLDVKFTSDILVTSPTNISASLLKSEKSNFFESSKTQVFKKDFLFFSGLEDKSFKQNILRKPSLTTQKKKKPAIHNTDNFTVLTS